MQLKARPNLFASEEGRYLFALHLRLLETLIEGKATTPMPGSHHP